MLSQTEIGYRYFIRMAIQYQIAEFQIPVYYVPIVQPLDDFHYVVKYLQRFLLAQPFLFNHVLLHVDQFRTPRPLFSRRASLQN
jgi:hypothetical protein